MTVCFYPQIAVLPNRQCFGQAYSDAFDFRTLRSFSSSLSFSDFDTDTFQRFDRVDRRCNFSPPDEQPSTGFERSLDARPGRVDAIANSLDYRFEANLK